ncbi:MAG TPA: PEP/pyruvate-binding domain-containing protein, partial [Anaerolineales bacterium]|nr:PEP/pyruvate-binding domain-containing protein [Anaerolineales bacterium]
LATEIQTAYTTLSPHQPPNQPTSKPTNQQPQSPLPNSQFLIPNSPFLLPNSPLPIAVRSSATAEDLPDLSFAGQQDTYLNVLGTEQLLDAVRACWGSLWTARAIGYRMRNHIPHEETALAVVVQMMVPSEVSGVLFTANPLTGARDETVIDATFGLGEALVSGQVEPDHFIVSQTGDIKAITLGAKQTATRGKVGGGVENIPESAAEQQTLPDATVRQLTMLGQQIQKEYGSPQDIEWALANGQLYILQARGITSLFPVPEISFDPLLVWISFGAVQGLVGPLTPLGQDTIRHVAAGGAGMIGVTMRPADLTVFASAGERMWIKVSDLLRHPLGQRAASAFIGFVEPSIGQILRSLINDPRLGAGKGRFTFTTARRLAGFFIPVLGRMIRNFLNPTAARARFDAMIDTSLARAHISPGQDRFEKLAGVVTYLRTHTAQVFRYLLPMFIPTFGPSMGALGLLTRLSSDANLALEVTRGLPRNVTTEMDLALWDTARTLRSDAQADTVFRATPASDLAQQYLAGTLPPAAQTALAHFLARYGMRGVGEIDFGQPRWRENPTPVIHTLQSYLQIEPEFAPDVLFAKGERAAEEAIEKIAAGVRQQRGGWLKEKLVRAAARRVRTL